MNPPLRPVALPLPDPRVYQGGADRLGDLRMVEVALHPRWVAGPGADRLVLSLSGRRPAVGGAPASVGGAVEELRISVSAGRDAVRVGRSGRPAVDVPADLTQDRFYAVSVVLDPVSDVVRLVLDADSDRMVEVEAHGLLGDLAFVIEQACVGALTSPAQEDPVAFEGAFAGLRLWSTSFNRRALEALYAWDAAKGPPTRANGFTALTGVGARLLAHLGVTGTEPATSLGLTFSVDPRGIRALAGSWVESASEHRGAPPKRQVAGVPEDRCCVFEASRYLAILEDDDQAWHLVSGDGRVLDLVSVEGAVYTFEGRQGEARGTCVVTDTSHTSEGSGQPLVGLSVAASGADLGVPSGAFNRPHRKERMADGSPWGSLFRGEMLPNLDDFFAGVDITEVDPFGRPKGAREPIFRQPGRNSLSYSREMNRSIPMGVTFVPEANFVLNGTTTFVTSQAGVERASGETVSAETNMDLGLMGSIGSVDVGLKQAWNEEVNTQTEHLLGAQELVAVDRWSASLHALVLDPPNIPLAGQADPDVDPKDGAADVVDPSNSFQERLLALKGGGDDDYDRFIRQFGTHFTASAQFGATGGTVHRFNVQTVRDLIQTGSKVSAETEWSASATGNLAAEVSGGFSRKSADGTSTSLTTTAESSSKKETTDIWALGVASEGHSADPQNAVIVRRHLRGLPDLLVPPFVRDLELITQVRPRLGERIRAYVTARAQALGAAAWVNPTFLAFTVSPPPADQVKDQAEFRRIVAVLGRVPPGSCDGTWEGLASALGISVNQLTDHIYKGVDLPAPGSLLAAPVVAKGFSIGGMGFHPATPKRAGWEGGPKALTIGLEITMQVGDTCIVQTLTATSAAGAGGPGPLGPWVPDRPLWFVRPPGPPTPATLKATWRVTVDFGDRKQTYVRGKDLPAFPTDAPGAQERSMTNTPFVVRLDFLPLDTLVVD